MDYEFGDILDARKAPQEHFLLLLGEVMENGRAVVMYYVITSRVYGVFKEVLAYFNDCLARGDVHFLRHFPKEKSRQSITTKGFPSQAIFLDNEKRYNGCLSVESMVLVNRDPERIDKSALDALRDTNKDIIIRQRLHKSDVISLLIALKDSDGVSPDRREAILRNYDEIKKKYYRLVAPPPVATPTLETGILSANQ